MCTKCEQQQKVCTSPPFPSGSNCMTIWEKPKMQRSEGTSLSHYYIYFVSLLWEWFLIKICQKKQHMIVYSPLLLNIQASSGAHPASSSMGTAVLFCVCSGHCMTLIAYPPSTTGIKNNCSPYMLSWRKQGQLTCTFSVNVYNFVYSD